VKSPRELYDLVIFDCDGVLVDSEPIANRVLAEQLSAVGLVMSVGEVMAKFIGKTRAGCLELATELLRRPLPENFAESWDASLFRALAREVKPTEGIRDLLDALDIQYCVASNSSAERMRISLSSAGLLPLFDGRTFSAQDVARPKPAPDLFLHAAKALNVAPSRTVVIEDTVIGVQAATAAGMAVLAYAVDNARHTTFAAYGAIPFDAMSKVITVLAEKPGN
jgi:HAD superfamily hydrolase (TIGR01509 family)